MVAPQAYPRQTRRVSARITVLQLGGGAQFPSHGLLSFSGYCYRYVEFCGTHSTLLALR